MEFSKLECFCLFVGHPRNGSSILGGMLDAHKNIVISHELNVLSGIKKRQKNKLLRSIINQSKLDAERERIQAGYKCSVGGDWQGKFEDLHVIGDKKADWTTLLLIEDPQRLNNLQKLVGVPIKFIHTIRNPFDNIATIIRRKEKNKTYTLSSGNERYMQNGVIGYYFDVILKGIKEIRSKTDESNWIEIHNEDLIINPRDTMCKIIEFLGQETYEEHLKLCADAVFDKPHQTRNSIEWKKKEIELVNEKINHYPFLKRYIA